jgi:hypothetical protein
VSALPVSTWRCRNLWRRCLCCLRDSSSALLALASSVSLSDSDSDFPVSSPEAVVFLRRVGRGAVGPSSSDSSLDSTSRIWYLQHHRFQLIRSHRATTTLNVPAPPQCPSRTLGFKARRHGFPAVSATGSDQMAQLRILRLRPTTSVWHIRVGVRIACLPAW